MTAGKDYYNYPTPCEGPDIPYYNPDKSNPVVRGLPLLIVASAAANLNLVSGFLWSNAGFSSLRKIKELEQHEPRYDPTVIPVAGPSAPAAGSYTNRSSVQDLAPNPLRRYYSVTDYHALYRSGRLTPTDSVEVLLPLIRRDTSPPGAHSVAFISTEVELVRKAAEASTLRYKQGKPLGILDGVPIAVKDEVDLDGYRKTLGSARDYTRDGGGTSWCVKKWEEEGAIILGKLNMHELGMDTSNNNPIHGTPLNPHNPKYYTGGSSGGSAYAVSTGLVPFAFGADAGGSIRIPSSYCGAYGLKPSHGRVSGNPTLNLATTCSVDGPIAASIADLEIAYRVMATPDQTHPSSSRFPPPRPHTGPRRKLLGIYRTWFDRADPSVLNLCYAALDHYKFLGYELIDITIPFLPEGQTAHAITSLCEISLANKGPLTDLSAPNKILISVGRQTPAEDFLLAQKLRNLLMQHLAYLFTTYPGLIIVTPATANAGWRIAGGDADLKYGVSDANATMRSMEFVWLANFAGCPALSAPVGYVDVDGHGEGKMPVGLMGMGEWGSEDALIEWGRDGEGILHGDGVEREGVKMPKGWVDVLGMAAKRVNEYG